MPGHAQLKCGGGLADSFIVPPLRRAVGMLPEYETPHAGPFLRGLGLRLQIVDEKVCVTAEPLSALILIREGCAKQIEVLVNKAAALTENKRKGFVRSDFLPVNSYTVSSKLSHLRKRRAQVPVPMLTWLTHNFLPVKRGTAEGETVELVRHVGVPAHDRLADGA